MKARMLAPAKIGAALSSIWTPALLVSLPHLEVNDDRMRTLLENTGVSLRPHAKAHKSSAICKWQEERARAAGAPVSGFCAQTLREATALLEAGCTDVLLTNELTEGAMFRLAETASRHPKATVNTLVDCQAHIVALETAAAAAGAKNVGALIEIECGQGRCGCPAASDTAVALARALVDSERLTFGGLHVYHGGIQHLRSSAERMSAVNVGPASAAESTAARLRAAGIDIPLVTGGGTGTFLQDIAAGTHGEVQPGSYLLMDGDYAGNADAQHKGFVQSLFIHTTVISADDALGRRVVDAGSKAVDLVSGNPRPTALNDDALAALLADVGYTSGGDEHGILSGVPEGALPVGSTLQLIPAHCDPTTNLHDFIVGVRGGAVEDIFEIDGRGYC
jgi:D-serine deaminase-like pyridoxal phosphate-dependent protein